MVLCTRRFLSLGPLAITRKGVSGHGQDVRRTAGVLIPDNPDTKGCIKQNYQFRVGVEGKV